MQLQCIHTYIHICSRARCTLHIREPPTVRILAGVGGPREPRRWTAITSRVSRFPERPPAISLRRAKRRKPFDPTTPRGAPRARYDEALSLTARCESSCRPQSPSPRTNWNVVQRPVYRMREMRRENPGLISRASSVRLVIPPRDVHVPRPLRT